MARVRHTMCIVRGTRSGVWCKRGRDPPRGRAPRGAPLQGARRTPSAAPWVRLGPRPARTVPPTRDRTARRAVE